MIVLDIVEEIYSELGAPSDLSKTLISFWLRDHIGDLNILISKTYSIDKTTSEISPSLDEKEKSILKELYFIYYLGYKANQVLINGMTDTALEVSENGATVRRLNKNEMAKTFLNLQAARQINLDKLVNLYKSGDSLPSDTCMKCFDLCRIY